MKYNDPLHIPSAERVVWHKGKEALILNKRLLDKQNCWQNLEQLKELHSERLHLCDIMNKTEDKDFLTLCDAYYTLIEFELQKLWGFPLDKKFHMFWYRDKCSCPIIDNIDRYPTGYYIINQECLLHGE